MQSMTRTATEQVDVLVLDPKNRKQMVDAFASWLVSRALVALDARAILREPLAEEDEENGLTREGIADGARLTVAAAAPWCSKLETSDEEVDTALLAWSSRVRVDPARVPAWCRRLREAQ